MDARRLTALAFGLALGSAGSGQADAIPQPLPFTQAWSDAGLITANDTWIGVPGIEGFRGDGLTGVSGADPQAVLAPDWFGVLDVNANQTSPDTLTTGGVAEFHSVDTCVALQGSNTASAPYLKVYASTSGLSAPSDVTVRYTLRDLDASSDDAVQPVALQYRVAQTGDFANVPAGFVPDATEGPSLASRVSPVCAALGPDALDQAIVEIRILTTNAVGSDEWVGVDDLEVSTRPCDGAPVEVPVFPIH